MKKIGPGTHVPGASPGSANARDITTLMKILTTEFYEL